MNRLSVVLIARNSEKTLAACLDSVYGLAAEIVLVDGGSSDRTPEIAHSRGARVIDRAFDGFGAQKQFALEQAAQDWVLLLDTDETVPTELASEIRQVLNGPQLPAAYRVPRRNHYFGRWLRFGGKYPDYQTRLLRRGLCRYSDDIVHEKVEVQGSLGTLRAPLIHDTYPDLDTWLSKLGLFARFRGEELFRKGERPSSWTGLRFCFWRPLWRFLRRYFLKLGFLDGLPGFLACVHDALTEILGYLVLRERARGQKP